MRRGVQSVTEPVNAARAMPTGACSPGGTRHHAMLLSYLVVGLLFRLLQLCLKGSNGKSERSPGKSVARTIRCVSIRYRISIAYISARSSERAFFRLTKALRLTEQHLRLRYCAAFFISGSREPLSIRLVVKSARWA